MHSLAGVVQPAVRVRAVRVRAVRVQISIFGYINILFLISFSNFHKFISICEEKFHFTELCTIRRKVMISLPEDFVTIPLGENSGPTRTAEEHRRKMECT